MFQNLLRNKTFTLRNKHLQTILYKIEFLFLSNNNIEILTNFQNESKIIIIDEYKDKYENKYFFICFDYKLIILSQEKSLQYLNDFLSKHEKSEKYFLKNNSTLGPNIKNAEKFFYVKLNDYQINSQSTTSNSGHFSAKLSNAFPDF